MSRVADFCVDSLRENEGRLPPRRLWELPCLLKRAQQSALCDFNVFRAGSTVRDDLVQFPD
jgi:hypothetical protein